MQITSNCIPRLKFGCEKCEELRNKLIKKGGKELYVDTYIPMATISGRDGSHEQMVQKEIDFLNHADPDLVEEHISAINDGSAIRLIFSCLSNDDSFMEKDKEKYFYDRVMQD